MKTVRQQAKSAASRAQNLSPATSPASAESAPGGPRTPGPASADLGVARRQTGAGIELEAEAALVRGDSSPLRAGASDIPSSSVAERVQRLESLIAREIGFLQRTGAHSLAVVIRPDPGTELLVQFSRRADGIEAVVRCERGDPSLLTQNWAQLRDALAGHEVRLLPFTDASVVVPEAPSSGGARGGTQEERAAQRQNSAMEGGEGWGRGGKPRPGPGDPDVPAGTATVRTAPGGAGGATRGRWESWA